jgi:hypothetical protein
LIKVQAMNCKPFPLNKVSVSNKHCEAHHTSLGPDLSHTREI